MHTREEKLIGQECLLFTVSDAQNSLLSSSPTTGAGQQLLEARASEKGNCRGVNEAKIQSITSLRLCWPYMQTRRAKSQGCPDQCLGENGFTVVVEEKALTGFYFYFLNKRNVGTELRVRTYPRVRK